MIGYWYSRRLRSYFEGVSQPSGYCFCKYQVCWEPRTLVGVKSYTWKRIDSERFGIINLYYRRQIITRIMFETVRYNWNKATHHPANFKAIRKQLTICVRFYRVEYSVLLRRSFVFHPLASQATKEMCWSENNEGTSTEGRFLLYLLQPLTVAFRTTGFFLIWRSPWL